MSCIIFKPTAPMDCITLGRANVDLYPPMGQQLNIARSYDVFVGGSPANIAVGLVKRGLRAGLISRVADDAHGHFVVDYLRSCGVDVSQVQRDMSGRKTSLAFAERRRDAKTIMYRKDTADLALNADELSQDYIQSAKVLFVSGTALAQESSRGTVHAAMSMAHAGNVCIAMDLDYRPYGWTSKEETQDVLRHAAQQCHVLIGTRDEFEVLGFESYISDEACASHFLQGHAQLVVIKHGKDGAHAFTKDGEEYRSVVVPAHLIKPWGAGDAFASSLLASLIQGVSLEEALIHGAAAASLVVSGTSCTEASPTGEELARFIQQWRDGNLDETWRD